jgi:hypothetical protein
MNPKFVYLAATRRVAIPRALSVRSQACSEMALIWARDKADHSEERTLLKVQDAQPQAAGPDARQEEAAARPVQQVVVAAGHAQQEELAAEPDAQQREVVARHAQQVAVAAGHAQQEAAAEPDAQQREAAGRHAQQEAVVAAELGAWQRAAAE